MRKGFRRRQSRHYHSIRVKKARSSVSDILSCCYLNQVVSECKNCLSATMLPCALGDRKSPLIGCPVICIWRVSPPPHTIRTHITNSQKENVFLRCPKCSSAGTHVNSVCSRTGSSTHKQICLNLSPTECSLYMFITLFAYVRSASGGNSLTQPL
jgi:hypothetical protein